MAQDKILGEQLDLIDVTDDIAQNPTAMGNIATGITNDPGATATLDAEYLRRDGSVSMDATLVIAGSPSDLQVGGDIYVGGDVDGVDVAALRTGFVDHIIDTTIHFTEATIDHANILNSGTYTHNQIDTHVGTTNTHFTEATIDHTNILNIGTNTHAEIDTHIADTLTHVFAADASNIFGGDLAGSSITTGANNLIGGFDSGKAVTSGQSNILLGNGAGVNIVGTHQNIAIGRNALGHATHVVGSGNTAIGTAAGQAVNDVLASNNIFIGAYCGKNTTGGACANNTAIGASALTGLNGGDNNTVIGVSSGIKIVNGFGNTCIGVAAGPTTDQSNQLYIDNIETDIPLIHGNFANDEVKINGELQTVALSESTISYGTIGSIPLDTSTGTYFHPTGTTTGVITFSFTNPASAGRVSSFTLELLGAGDNAPVWPASVKWPGGAEPTWTASAGSPIVNGSDIVSFITRDGGTTWMGMLGGLAFT